MIMWRHCNPSLWRHQMQIFSALLTLCAGNSAVTGECPSQSPVTRSKRSRGWWFETQSRSSWRHCNVHLPSWSSNTIRLTSSRESNCCTQEMPSLRGATWRQFICPEGSGGRSSAHRQTRSGPWHPRSINVWRWAQSISSPIGEAELRRRSSVTQKAETRFNT